MLNCENTPAASASSQCGVRNTPIVCPSPTAPSREASACERPQRYVAKKPGSRGSASSRANSGSVDCAASAPGPTTRARSNSVIRRDTLLPPLACRVHTDRARAVVGDQQRPTEHRDVLEEHDALQLGYHRIAYAPDAVQRQGHRHEEQHQE